MHKVLLRRDILLRGHKALLRLSLLWLRRYKILLRLWLSLGRLRRNKSLLNGRRLRWLLWCSAFLRVSSAIRAKRNVVAYLF